MGGAGPEPEPAVAQGPGVGSGDVGGWWGVVFSGKCGQGGQAQESHVTRSHGDRHQRARGALPVPPAVSLEGFPRGTEVAQ